MQTVAKYIGPLVGLTVCVNSLPAVGAYASSRGTTSDRLTGTVGVPESNKRLSTLREELRAGSERKIQERGIQPSRTFSRLLVTCR